MRAERPILLRFLNVLTSLNGFIIKRIVFLFLVKYIASGTLSNDNSRMILIIFEAFFQGPQIKIFERVLSECRLIKSTQADMSLHSGTLS
jgi:hypothetical protein